jgi:hypothetical protein
MAFEDLINVAQVVVWFGIVLFPAMYLLVAIRDRIETKTLMRKAMVVLLMSVLISLAVYPFIAALMQYVITLETQIETGASVQVSLVLFDSDYMTYVIALLVIFLVYLAVYNRTK